jgi:hypothetical protein
MGLVFDDADDVVEKLEGWAAVDGDEAENEEALYHFLNHAFDSAIVHRQYWQAKTRADLLVVFESGPKVAVEVKANLTDRNEYHRLVGQVFSYLSEWECHVVLVLCGECDPALVKLTKRAIDFLNANCSPQARLVDRVARSTMVA